MKVKLNYGVHGVREKVDGVIRNVVKKADDVFNLSPISVRNLGDKVTVLEGVDPAPEAPKPEANADAAVAKKPRKKRAKKKKK